MSKSTESEKATQLLARETAGEFLKQRTPVWYDARGKMLTASEIASVLDCNIYQSSYDLLLKKLKPGSVGLLDSPALEWGNKFEPVAVQFYEFLSNEVVHEIGLVTHAIHKWLGASPDGLILSGKLLEIKCPFMRSIGDEIPIYYWIQMQIQMEVCDMNVCDYLECEFHQYATKEDYVADTSVDISLKGVHVDTDDAEIYWRLDGCSLKTVARDRVWFADNLETLRVFYNKMSYYKELGTIGLETLYNDVKLKKKSKKRSRLFESPRSSKRSRSLSDVSDGEFIDWKYWVSASSIRNYMINDPILDWLEYYSSNSLGTKPYIKYSDGEYKYMEAAERCESLDEFISTQDFNKTGNAFQACIMKKGVVFETQIIDMIREKFPDDFIEIGSYQHSKSSRKYLETVDQINKGTPIIYQGVLHDFKTQTFGVPDLLVRFDYLNKIFNEKVIGDRKIIKSKNGKPWHYRVVEIKFSSLNLCADGKHLRNINSMASNKGQLYIYNKILGNIQDYTPSKSYILGKKSFYKKGSQVFMGGPFDRVAHVDFRVNDAFIRTQTALAVKWIRAVRSKGYSWKLFPPSRNELRPNMCNTSDGIWHNIKTQIAEKQNDITQLWMCGVKNREHALKRGVKNWRMHPKLTAEKLGVTGDKVANTLQLILDYNQDPMRVEPFIPLSKLPKKYLIYPRRIKTKLFKWRKSQKIEMFIDFETVSDLISDGDFSGSLIFNVGIGYILDGELKFKGFTAEGLTVDDERKLIVDMHNFIYEMAQKHNGGKQPKLWHWSHAERTFYRSSMIRHIDLIPTEQLLKNWCDLLKIFRDEPIVVRGALKFNLKSIVKAFSDHGFIKTSYQESNVANGLDAMVLAYQEHIKCKSNGTKFMDSKIIKDIEYYNQIDCLVLGEILTYLRSSH